MGAVSEAGGRGQPGLACLHPCPPTAGGRVHFRPLWQDPQPPVIRKLAWLPTLDERLPKGAGEDGADDQWELQEQLG